MKKWMWLTIPATVVVLALGLWGGVVLAQGPANPEAPVAPSGNWTEMYNYCQNAPGMIGSGGNTTGMMGGGMMDMMMDMMHGGGMMGAGNMTGHGDMMGGNMTSGGMMGMGGMMGR